jgi:hypothetical protein
MWVYKQSTGDYTYDGAELLSTGHELFSGYAGCGDGLNNPDMQQVPDVGPLPEGFYSIGPAYNHPALGPVTMNLSPDAANEMFGRGDFRIHGRKFPGDMGASHGCIVLDHAPRVSIAGSGDRRLQVIR